MPLPDDVCTLLARQHALVSRVQLMRDLGYSGPVVDGWRRRGLLVTVARHRGVYAAPGAPLVAERRAMAAVLRSGRGARVSGKACCGLHGLEGFHADARPLVLVPRGRQVTTVPFEVRSADLTPVECATVRGVPGVDATRALFDAACQGITEKALRVGLDDARRKGLLRADRVALRAERLQWHPGARTVRALFASGAMRMESEGERALAPLLADFDPQPEWGVWVCGNRYRVDAYWAVARLAAEFDGRERHMYGTNLDEDHPRRLALLAADIVSVPISYSMVRDTPEETRLLLRQVLATRLGAVA